MQADDTTVRIPLRSRDGSVRAYALIDAADADWVNQWRWSRNAFGYAVRGARIDGHSYLFFLHRQLLGLAHRDGLDGDHINRDRLDNRRNNLRILTRAQNLQNVPSRTGTTSVHRGVSWDKTRGCWRATIQVGGKWKQLGRYPTEEAAADVARAARANMMPFSTD